MSGLARQFDPVSCPADLHGAPPFVMSFPVIGMFTEGSANTLCNSRPAVRLGDGGPHVACPGANRFAASSGAVKTLINGRPAVRAGDATTHCGNPASVGHVMAGLTSPNTLVGQ